MNPFNYLVVNLSNRCNTVCRYCFQSANSDPKRDVIDFDLFKRAADYVLQKADPERRILHITGGEPMMNPDFFEILHYGLNKGFIVRVQTNGLMIADMEKKYEEYFKYPNISVKISLDGCTREQHEYLREEGTFDTVIRSIRRLTSLNRSIGIKTCIHHKNLDAMKAILDMCLEMGVAGFSYNIIRLEGDAKRLNQAAFQGITEMDVVKRLVPYFSTEKYRHLMNGNQIPLYYFSSGKGMSCGSQFYIDYDGRIYSYQQCLPQQYIGDVKEDSWDRQFNVKRACEQEYIIPLDPDVVAYVKRNLVIA